MQHEEAKKLLEKYKAGLCTEEEQAIIESWYLQLPLEETDLSEAELTEAVNRVEGRLPVVAPKRYSVWPKLLAASVVIGVLSISIFLLLKKSNVPQYTANNNQGTIKPCNKAILTLAGGKQILLNDSNVGQLATQGSVTVNKTSRGEVHYDAQPSAGSGAESLSNNITTPRGGQYELKLADGTRVWLNAASSITYPVAFNGTSREVSITGEVYFEVAKDKARPFRVKSGAQTVEVLGTHFNINTYQDNAPVTETTLLEGSVKVTNHNNTVIIKPGQQAQASSAGAGKIVVMVADTGEVMAWRKGDLQFDNENVHTIMNKVSRLYNMDVAYNGKISDERFGGTVSHPQDVTELLEVLQKTCNVHFKVEGRRILVMP